MRLLLCLTLALVIAAPLAAEAAEYHVDPVSGSPANDGSRAAPWRSLQDVIDDVPLTAGDTVWLASGSHGRLVIRGRRNEATVTIASAPGEAPVLHGVQIVGSRNWLLRGVEISPPDDPGSRRAPILAIGGDAENITIEDCTISSADDASGWSAADWRRRAFNGVHAAGRRIVLRGNTIRNVSHGIDMTADDSLVERNLIENFSGDGIRGLGDRTIYQFNTIKNCYAVDDNHDDGFQSWSVGPSGRAGNGEVVGGVLRGNRIINYEDPKQPLRCTLQGIGMFDGVYVDWVIENNVVIVNHWHGITVMGARNVRIVNNTVLDPNDRRPGPPWISITHHKDGRPPEKSLIANNLAPRRAKSDGNRFGLPKPGVETARNITVVIPRRFFVDPEAFDLHLRAGSPAIDAGDARFAPATDIDGTPRPQGAGVDVGAYEGGD